MCVFWWVSVSLYRGVREGKCFFVFLNRSVKMLWRGIVGRCRGQGLMSREQGVRPWSCERCMTRGGQREGERAYTMRFCHEAGLALERESEIAYIRFCHEVGLA